MAREKLLRSRKMIRSRSGKMTRSNIGGVEGGNKVAQKEEGECGQELWRNSSPSTWKSFLETVVKSPRVQRMSSCSVYTLKPLFTLHLGLSKLVKECQVS